MVPVQLPDTTGWTPEQIQAYREAWAYLQEPGQVPGKDAGWYDAEARKIVFGSWDPRSRPAAPAAPGPAAAPPPAPAPDTTQAIRSRAQAAAPATRQATAAATREKVAGAAGSLLAAGGQLVLGVTANDIAQKENREALKRTQGKLASGQVLSPEEEASIRESVITPAAQANMQAERRADRMEAAALGARGGSSGADLAANRAQTRAATSATLVAAEGQVRDAETQRRRELQQEEIQRQGLKQAMRADDFAQVGQAIGAIATPLGALAGVPPGFFQAARFFGAPQLQQLVPEAMPGNPPPVAATTPATTRAAPPAPTEGTGKRATTGLAAPAELEQQIMLPPSAPPATVAPSAPPAPTPVAQRVTPGVMGERAGLPALARDMAGGVFTNTAPPPGAGAVPQPPPPTTGTGARAGATSMRPPQASLKAALAQPAATPQQFGAALGPEWERLGGELQDRVATDPGVYALLAQAYRDTRSYFYDPVSGRLQTAKFDQPGDPVSAAEAVTYVPMGGVEVTNRRGAMEVALSPEWQAAQRTIAAAMLNNPGLFFMVERALIQGREVYGWTPKSLTGRR